MTYNFRLRSLLVIKSWRSRLDQRDSSTSCGLVNQAFICFLNRDPVVAVFSRNSIYEPLLIRMEIQLAIAADYLCALSVLSNPQAVAWISFVCSSKSSRLLSERDVCTAVWPDRARQLHQAKCKQANGLMGKWPISYIYNLLTKHAYHCSSAQSALALRFGVSENRPAPSAIAAIKFKRAKSYRRSPSLSIKTALSQIRSKFRARHAKAAC